MYASDAEVAGVAGTGEQILGSYSLPANSLYKNNQALRIRAIFKHAANTQVIDPKLYFGSVSLLLEDCATSGQAVSLSMLVARRSAGNQMIFKENSGIASAAGAIPSYAAGTEDETAAILIKATVQGDTTGADMSLESLRVEFLQNP